MDQKRLNRYVQAIKNGLIVQINIKRGLKTIMYKTKRDRHFERLNLSLTR